MNNEYTSQTISFSTGNGEVLRIGPGNTIWHLGRLISTDQEIIDGMRDLVRQAQLADIING